MTVEGYRRELEALTKKMERAQEEANGRRISQFQNKNPH
jgi:hypothetical protein